MAKTSTLHVRVEPSVKQKAEETLKVLGLSTTEAINIFLNQIILYEGIPFEIKKPKYNKETMQALEDVKNGENLSETFDNVDELFKELEN